MLVLLLPSQDQASAHNPAPLGSPLEWTAGLCSWGWSPLENQTVVPTWSLGSGLDVMGGPLQRQGGGVEAHLPQLLGLGPARGTLRGWQAMPLSMSLPPTPRSAESHTQS